MPTKYIYSKVIYNKNLGVSKEIKAQTSCELDIKIKDQRIKWHEQEKKKKEKQREEDLRYQAEQDTQKVLLDIDKYKNILIDSLSLDHSIDINKLKKTYEFKEFEFKEEPPNIEDINTEIGVPEKHPILELFFQSMENERIKLENDAKNLFDLRIKEYNEKKEKAKNEYYDRKEKVTNKIKEFNNLIDKLKKDLENGEEYAIEKYINLVLKKSKYPHSIKKQYEIQYDSISEVLIISYELPSKNEIPDIIEYRYIMTRKEISEIKMKFKEFNRYYEDILYKICLRNVYEVYQSLQLDSLKTVVFNGWIKGIDPKTGNDFHACIMSLQVAREEFYKLNLERVNPKECFKNLKGISAGPLSEIAPIKPILDLNRSDSRFVTPREVLDKLEDGTNLANMDWEDFEHLVRELFQKIFHGENCEVNVTQASRDCGVDAIAFDPDPIRGGKFVIQAKRYNNVVPTSAIRDLYGTMMSEGANKGILVTTSYFGCDSRKFAKDKPISLIDGARLLYMFKDHGYNLNIKLKRKNKGEIL